jgi:hypothetical protein
MATEFCREYLSSVLKAKSRKFFGTGALNVDEIMKRRAESWKIEAVDIAIDQRGDAPRTIGHYGGVGIPQVVSSTSIAQVEVGAPTEVGEAAAGETVDVPTVDVPTREQKILRIVDRSGSLAIDGYNFRMMDAPAKTFGNEIQTMTEMFAFWFGNRVTYVFSDGVETAFHYELRLNSFVTVDTTLVAQCACRNRFKSLTRRYLLRFRRSWNPSWSRRRPRIFTSRLTTIGSI